MLHRTASWKLDRSRHHLKGLAHERKVGLRLLAADHMDPAYTSGIAGVRIVSACESPALASTSRRSIQIAIQCGFAEYCIIALREQALQWDDRSSEAQVLLLVDEDSEHYLSFRNPILTTLLSEQIAQMPFAPNRNSWARNFRRPILSSAG